MESLEPTSSLYVQQNQNWQQHQHQHHQQYHDQQQQQLHQPNESTQQLDDTYSTDSSGFDDELKKRRRKLRFPFSKKTFCKNKHI